MKVTDTHLTVDKLQIPRALRVAVACAILGTGLVVLIGGQTTVRVHGDEVQSAVETTWKVGHIHVEGELLVQQLEHLVGVLVLHQKQTRTNVASSDEAKGQGIAVSLDTVRGFILCPVKRTVCGAGLVIRAKSLVPLLQMSISGLAGIGNVRTSFPV